MFDLSIIIVSYNTKQLMIDCIKALISSKTKYNYEIIVVDNDSKDGTPEELATIFPKIKVFARHLNDGFAAANNYGAARATGKYVWLLNSDTLVFNDTIEELMDSTIKANSMIASCRLLYEDKTLQPQGGAIPNLSNITTWMLNLDTLPLINALIPPYQEKRTFRFEPRVTSYGPIKFGWLGGTALLVRRDLYESMLGLDDHIFMYGEDVEFCLRAKKQDISVDYFSEPALIHLGQRSGSKERSIVGEFTGLSYIMEKHGNWFDRLYLRFMLKTGALLRIVMYTLMNKPTAGRFYAAAFKVV